MSNATIYVEGASSMHISEWSDRQLYDAIVYERDPALRQERIKAAVRLGRRTPPDLAGRSQSYRGWNH